MSLFKEKDDLIKSAFKHLEYDSDDEDEEEASEEGSTSGENSFEKHSGIQHETSIDKEHENVAEHDEIITSGPTKSPESCNEDEIDISQESSKSDVSCIELMDDSSSNDCTATPKNNNVIRSRSQTNRIDDVIDISSDDDNIMVITPRKSSQFLAHNTSIEDHDFTLKFTIAGIYRQYHTTYKASLAEALKSLLDDLSATNSGLKLFCNDQEVSLDMSPMSLGLKSGTILHAIEVPLAGGAAEDEEKEEEISIDSNALSLKLQDGNRKHTKEFRISKNEPIARLKSDYAKAFNLDSSTNIKLFFDGDELDDKSTAEDLELEDGFALDVVVA